MKNLKLFTLLICIIILTNGCSTNVENTKVETDNVTTVTNEEQSNHTPTDSDQTTKVQAEIDYDWQIVIDQKLEQQANLVGFLDMNNGVSIGFNGSKQYTNDGGMTWIEAENASLCRFGLDIYDDQIMISCGNGGQNRLTIDGGKTWQEIGDFPLVNTAVNRHIYMIDTDTIWIGSRYAIGLSTDGGLTFNTMPLPEGITQLQTMYFNGPSTGYLVSTDGILYKTIDACESYEEISQILDPSLLYDPEKGNGAIHFYNENEGIYFYTNIDYKLYILRTLDGGITWQTETVEEIFTPVVHISRDGQLISCFTKATKEVKVLKYTK